MEAIPERHRDEARGSESGLGVNPETGALVRPVVESADLCDDSVVGTTVVIVDDHKAFRRSARKLLELGGFDVVGEAEDGAMGTALVRELEPDVVLLDVALPDTSGFAVAEELADVPSSVVLVSSRDPEDLGPLIAKSPAVGFIRKEQLSTAAIRELLEAA
jgi:DNA-binding NarL/FixJ family response regulator